MFAAWYFSNIFIFPHEKKGDEHILQFPMPDGDKMVGFDAEQIGLWARNAFRDPEAWNGELWCGISGGNNETCLKLRGHGAQRGTCIQTTQ